MTGRQETAGDDQDTHMGRRVLDVRTQDTERGMQCKTHVCSTLPSPQNGTFAFTNFYSVTPLSAFPSFFSVAFFTL